MNIRVLDILDILIVAYFLYLIYKLLKGTIAFRIIIGVLLLYVIWWIVNVLDMQLLELLLGKFVGYGVIILIIIFQQEVRKFLLFLGNSTFKRRFTFINSFFDKNFIAENDKLIIEEIKSALLNMSKTKTGALLVFSSYGENILVEKNGIILDSKINRELIESVFNKYSPLHDGAMIITGRRIHSVSSILPVSANHDIPKRYGTRHRSGIGISEVSSAIAFIVSEETGAISYARGGVLKSNLDEKAIEKILEYQFNRNK